MDFSVLMSVYAQDKPIHYSMAVESITTKQTLKPNQVVIVFDGPVSDEIEKATAEIKLKNPDIEFTIVRQEKNLGLATALNTGIGRCKYEFVARMDSDDVAVADRFEKQIGFFLIHPDIDVLGGAIAEFQDDPDRFKLVREVGHSHNEIVKMAKMRTPFNHMTVVYKKKKILEVGGYNTEFGKLEDYKLWVDLIAYGCRMANLEDILIHMRVGNGLINRRSNRREIHDWDKLQKDLLKAGIVSKFESILNKVYIRIFTYMPARAKKVAYRIILRRKCC